MKNLLLEEHPREKYLKQILQKLKRKEILFLTGMRRVGKTTLIKQAIDHLIEYEKISPEKILFLSCDNIVFNDRTIFEIIEVYRKIKGIKVDEEFYLFIDEIAYLKNFHQQLKNLYDSWNLKVLCSSSSMIHLNDEKAFLIGRTSTVEVYPLTYKEFLTFKKLELQKYDTSLNKKYFEEYLKQGGLPEYVIKQDPQYLVDLLNSIIEKDIISNYRIREEKTVKELFKLVCLNIGKPISYNKLSKILKIKPETVKKYLGYFEKTYLFFSCKRFSKSTNEKIVSPKKFYIIDNGLNFVSYFKKGIFFENLVFINLHKRREVFEDICYYFKNGIEIDFVTDRFLIEAKYEDSELTDKQKKVFNKIKRKKQNYHQNLRRHRKFKQGFELAKTQIN